MIFRLYLALFVSTSLSLLFALTACAEMDTKPSAVLLSSSSVPLKPTPESWLRMPEMSDSATQADYGAEIYRLVCRDCHGDQGQGLTDQWRSTWAPEDQNCWQSRCHVGNHPPEGFLLPRYVPPIIGSGTLSNHETALDLYNYIRQRMPWHNPGSLQDWEYMQLTAFIARERALDLTLPLDEAAAAKLKLSP
jgi:cytochrome c